MARSVLPSDRWSRVHWPAGQRCCRTWLNSAFSSWLNLESGLLLGTQGRERPSGAGAFSSNLSMVTCKFRVSSVWSRWRLYLKFDTALLSLAVLGAYCREGRRPVVAALFLLATLADLLGSAWVGGDAVLSAAGVPAAGASLLMISFLFRISFWLLWRSDKKLACSGLRLFFWI